MAHNQSEVLAEVQKIFDDPISEYNILRYGSAASFNTPDAINRSIEASKEFSDLLARDGDAFNAPSLNEKYDVCGKVFNKVSELSGQYLDAADKFAQYLTCGDIVLEKYDQEFIPQAQQKLIDAPSIEAETYLEKLKICRNLFIKQIEQISKLEDSTVKFMQRCDDLKKVITSYPKIM